MVYHYIIESENYKTILEEIYEDDASKKRLKERSKRIKEEQDNEKKEEHRKSRKSKKSTAKKDEE